MALQVCAHECALRDDLEAPGTDVRQGVVDEPAAVALPLEGGVDLGMNQDDGIGQRALGDGPHPLVADPQLVAMLRLVIGQAWFGGIGGVDWVALQTIGPWRGRPMPAP
jgi:hypothetical protein